MPYKTAKPAAARKGKPAAEVTEPTASERLIAAHATGNMALVRQVQTELGLSAAPGERRDALVRTARKPAAEPKPKRKAAR